MFEYIKAWYFKRKSQRHEQIKKEIADIKNEINWLKIHNRPPALIARMEKQLKYLEERLR